MHTFSIRETVKFAWITVRNNLGFFITLSVLVVGVLIVGLYSLSYLPIVALLALVISLVLVMWLIRVGLDAVDGKKLAFSNIIPAREVLLKFFRLSIVFALSFVILRQVASIILLALAFGGLGASLFELLRLAFLLFIICAIYFYFFLRFMFSLYYVVDQKAGPFQSVKASWHTTRGSLWRLAGLMFIIYLLNFPGTIVDLILLVGYLIHQPFMEVAISNATTLATMKLVFGFGLLITIPITIVALASAYRSLAGRRDFVPTPAGDLVEPVPTPTITIGE
jgi:hypothetical protein